MLYPIDELPDGVVGVVADGRVSGDDYERVLVPAIDDALSRHEKIRLLYHCPAGSTLDAGAAWEDARVGLEHFKRFERVAVVTDEGWLVKAVALLGFMMPGEVRRFSGVALEEARAWITAI